MITEIVNIFSSSENHTLCKAKPNIVECNVIVEMKFGFSTNLAV